MFNNRHDILMFNIKKKLSEILSKIYFRFDESITCEQFGWTDG